MAASLMPTDEPVRWAADVSISLDQPALVARLGSTAVSCGAVGARIVELFQHPCSFRDAMEALERHVASATGLAEAMQIINRLWQAGLLESAAGAASGRRAGLGAAAIHVAMLDDRTRTDAFIRAIRSVVQPGDVVVDVGTGTGVLAVAAAQAGARRVFAIEASDIADVAEAMIIANGVADRVTLIRGWSTTVTTSEPADVIVSEILGHDAWDESLVMLLADARRRLAKPDVRVIPAEVRVLAQPVVAPDEEARKLMFAPDNVHRWSEWYGMRFDALLAFETPPAHASVSPQEAAAWPTLAEPVVMSRVDLARGFSLVRQPDAMVTALRDGVINGAVISWEADLAPGIMLSTRPAAASDGCHWLVRFVPFDPPVKVNAGDRIVLSESPGGSMRVDVTPTRGDGF